MPSIRNHRLPVPVWPRKYRPDGPESVNASMRFAGSERSHAGVRFAAGLAGCLAPGTVAGWERSHAGVGFATRRAGCRAPGTVAAHLSQAAVLQGGMLKISASVAVAPAPTMVGGVFGSNFRHVPDPEWVYYPVVLVVAAVACLSLHRPFEPNGWL